MLDSLRHSLRFLGVARVLARHDALFWIDTLSQAPRGLRPLIRLATRFARRRRGLPDAPGRRLAEALRSLGPAYIKLGQMLATRPDLIGAALAEELRDLQDSLPPFDPAQARARIAAELGQPLHDIFADFRDTAVAAASVAQVHKAKTPDGRIVAVKILRPDIEADFRRDLAAFRWAAMFVERFLPQARRLRPHAVVETIADSVAHELDLRLEAAAAAELAENMAGEPGYRIPAVDWQRTGRTVLTLEWVDGIPLSDVEALRDAGFDRGKLAATVVRVFLLQAMRDGVFHADLHQGNLFVDPDGTLVALDFGIVGRLDRASRRYLAEILYGFQERDYARVARWHFSAGYVPPGHSESRFAEAMRAIAEPIFDRPARDISAGRLLGQLFATTEHFGMQTQPQLILLQRSMVMVEGMALHLDTEANMWALSRPVIAEWIRGELSPELVLADSLHEIRETVTRLPAMLARADRLLQRMEQDRAQEHRPADSARPNEMRPARGAALLALALAAAALAVALVN